MQDRQVGQLRAAPRDHPDVLSAAEPKARVSKRTFGNESYIFQVSILIFMNFGVSICGFDCEESVDDAIASGVDSERGEVGKRAWRRDMTPRRIYGVCSILITASPQPLDLTCALWYARDFGRQNRRGRTLTGHRYRLCARNDMKSGSSEGARWVGGKGSVVVRGERKSRKPPA